VIIYSYFVDLQKVIDVEQVKDLLIDDKIVLHFMMPELGEESHHIFRIIAVIDEENPLIENHYWTDKNNFGPARKFVLEHYPTKKVFFLIIPDDYDKEQYIYFTNEEGIPGDNYPLSQIEIII
jgi:hypothetical protein